LSTPWKYNLPLNCLNNLCVHKNKLQYNDVDPDKKITLENEYQLSKDNSDCLKDNSDCLKDESDPENCSIDNNINESGSSSDVDMIIIESGNRSD
jgi:hypothetical protein